MSAAEQELDAPEVSVDFLDDEEMELDEGGEVAAPRVRVAASVAIRRKIEERLERRRLREELGLNEDDLDW